MKEKSPPLKIETLSSLPPPFENWRLKPLPLKVHLILLSWCTNNKITKTSRNKNAAKPGEIITKIIE